MTQTHLRKLALTLTLVTAALGSLAQAQTATPPVTKAAPSSAPKANRPSKTSVSSEIRYYDADPLSGGKLISTATVTPVKGQDRFAGAPANAKFVALETPRGTDLIDLSQKSADGKGAKGNAAPAATRAGGHQNAPKDAPSQDARGPKSPKGDNARGPQNGPGKGGPGMNGPRAGGLTGVRAGEKITFYSGNPLSGGTVLSSFDGSSTVDQTALDTAAKSAKFAVLERGGVRHIVDLSLHPIGRQDAPKK